MSVEDALKEIAAANKQGPEDVEKYVGKLRDDYACSWPAVRRLGAEGLQELGLPKGLAYELFQKAEDLASEKLKEAQKQALLPFPCLKENEYPEPSKMASHLTNLNGVTLPNQAVQEGKAINFEALHCSEWMSIMMNCNALAARTMTTLEPVSRSILIPPNSANSIRKCTLISMTGSEYTAGLSFSEKFNKHASLSAFNAFTRVASPFIAGALDYKQQTETQSIRKGTTLCQTMKYIMPIGRWMLRPGYEVLVDDNDKENVTTDPFIVDPALDASFRPLLEIEVKKDNLEYFKEKLSEKFAAWGEIFATDVSFGMASYSSSITTCESAEDMDKFKKALQSGVNGAYNMMEGEAGLGRQKDSGGEAAEQSKEQSQKWQVIGGVGSTEPAALERSRGDVNAWRCIHYKEFCPIMDFLKADIRKRIDEWQELVPLESPSPAPEAPEPEKPIKRVGVLHGATQARLIKHCGFDAGRYLTCHNSSCRDGDSLWAVAHSCNDTRSIWGLECEDESKSLYRFRSHDGKLLASLDNKRDGESFYAISHKGVNKHSLFQLHEAPEHGPDVFRIMTVEGAHNHPRFLTAHGPHAKRDEKSSWAIVHSNKDNETLWRLEVVESASRVPVRLIKHCGWDAGKYLTCHDSSRRDGDSLWAVAHSCNDFRSIWVVYIENNSGLVRFRSHDGKFLASHNRAGTLFGRNGDKRDGESFYAISHKGVNKHSLFQLHEAPEHGPDVFRIMTVEGAHNHPRFLTAHGPHAKRDEKSSWAIVHSRKDNETLWKMELVEDAMLSG